MSNGQLTPEQFYGFLTAKLENMEYSISQVNSKIDKLQDSSARMETTLNRNQQDIKELKEDVPELQEAVVKLQTEASLKAGNGKYFELKSKIEKVEANICKPEDCSLGKVLELRIENLEKHNSHNKLISWDFLKVFLAAFLSFGGGYLLKVLFS